MTRKTKSEKLAQSLKAIRTSQINKSTILSSDSSPQILSKEDAIKTFFTTALVLSTIALVFVLQTKGYIR